jgi:hypothetical protein
MCNEYRRLFDAYQEATAEYTQSVGALSRTAAGSSQFTALWRACENARIASEQARIALDTHIAEHGCVGQTLAGR